MSVLLAAIRKEVLLLLRDRGALIMMFILPVVFMAVFGAMFSGQGDSKQAPAAMTAQAPAAEAPTIGGIPMPLAPASPAILPDSFQVAVPGNAVLFGFFLALTVAMGFVEDRRSGIWRRALAAPMSRRTLLLSKLVPYVAIGMVQMTLLFGIGVVVFGMNISGSVFALGVHTFAVVLCAVCLGLLMASFSATEKQLGGIGSVVLLVMGLLGGAMVPRMAMPEGLKTLSLAVPHAWALDGYYSLLVVDGAGLADVASDTACVLGFAVGFAILGAVLFRFERD